MKNTNEKIQPENVSRLIDRLVCGELDETTRTQLIGYVEEHRDEWRRVGIAFLESQCWGDALQSETKSQSMRAMVALLPDTTSRSNVSTGRSIWSWIPLLAASWAVVFAGGWWFRNVSRPMPSGAISQGEELTRDPTSETLVWATVNSRALYTPLQGARLQLPIRMQGDEMLAVSFRTNISDYERDQLRRMGVELKTEERYLNATLPDGRDVSIPLEHYIATKAPVALN
jgi:hypothetical protein